MSGQRSQSKGRAGELELCRLLQERGYPVQPGRALSFGESPDLSGLPGIHIECKRCEQVRLSDWMAQAERDAERFRDGAPTVFHRRSRSPWLVTMQLSDWMVLYDVYKRLVSGTPASAAGTAQAETVCALGAVRAKP